MPRLSKRMREEWAFFLHPKTKRRTYNNLCRGCVNDCEQSFRAFVIECPRHLSKRAVYYTQNTSGKSGK